RIAIKLRDPNCDVDAEYADKLQALADAVAKRGATVKEIEPKLDTVRLHEVYVLLLRAATSVRTSEEDVKRWGQTLTEIDAAKEPYLNLTVRGNKLPHRDWLKLNNERHGLRRAFAAFFADWDILLCPAAASAAWPHDQEGERWQRKIAVNGNPVASTDQLFWAGYASLVYLPATVGPAGLAKSGLPVGYQAIAASGRDKPRPPLAASSKRKSSALLRRRASTDCCPGQRLTRSSMPRRIGLRFCDARHGRQHGGTRGELQKLPSVRKFHSIIWSARLCRGLRRRLPRDEFPALWRFCPGVEEYELQAARLAVDLRLDRRAAGDECGVTREAHLAITAGCALVLRLSRAQGGKPCRLGVGEPRGVRIEKLVVKHRLERGEIPAAHRCVALVLEGEDFLVAAHRQTSLSVSRACASFPGAFIRSFRRRNTCRSRNGCYGTWRRDRRVNLPSCL